MKKLIRCKRNIRSVDQNLEYYRRIDREAKMREVLCLSDMCLKLMTIGKKAKFHGK